LCFCCMKDLFCFSMAIGIDRWMDESMRG
jgi:hypothetical protein